MNFFNKFKIRTKLIILITVMTIGIIALGLTGYAECIQSENSLTGIYKNNLLRIQMLGDAKGQIRMDYANLLNLMLNADSGNMEDIKKQVVDNKDSFGNYMKDYRKNSLDDTEKKQLDLIDKYYSTWCDVEDQMVQMISDHSTTEADILYKTKGDKTFVSLNECVSTLTVSNIKKASDLYKKSSDEAQKAKVILLSLVIIVSVVSVLISFLIVRSITYPIGKLVELIGKTADFNIVQDASLEQFMKNKDEVGSIVRSVLEMRSSLKNMVGKIIVISTRLSESAEELSASTEENSKTINQVVSAINEVAEGNSVQAEKINESGNTLSQVAARIDEVNKSTSKSAESAENSMEVINEGQSAVDITTDKMMENIMVVSQVSSSINELSEVIGKVSSITEVINSIASQTNLLALNAAIEAARAGEAGKGFSVVAEEIRKLAEGSSAAANEIAAIVQDTIGKSASASENMNKVKEIVNEQEAAVTTTKDAFEKIKESVEGITESIKTVSQMLEEIDTATKEISGHTQDMAAIAEESAASSQEISASSEEQLASVELIAKASSDLSGMAAELSNEMKVFKL